MKHGRALGFRVPAQDSSAILINSYNNAGFMQLDYFPRLGRFSGNFYMSKALGEFKRVGTVSLERRK